MGRYLGPGSTGRLDYMQLGTNKYTRTFVVAAGPPPSAADLVTLDDGRPATVGGHTLAGTKQATSVFKIGLDTN